MTPEKTLLALIKRFEKDPDPVGRALNEIRYEDGVPIMRRLAQRFGYVVEKVEYENG